MIDHKNEYEKFASLIVIGFMLSAILTAAVVIRPVSGEPAWWNLNWEFRKPITIYHSNVTSDLANFPVLVNITDSDLATKAQVGGDDIVFTDTSGLKLDHEIEYYNGTSGLLVAWIRIPDLSSTTDTVIYMYYGNPDALNQESVQQVWDADYMMTQHFNERYENGECRFWGMIAGTLPQTEVMDELVDLPNSLRIMGATNPNGWGLDYYNNTGLTIRKGQPAANVDPNFNASALELATSGAWIGVGHVRKSASPPYNVPDPHPFNRTKMGVTWVFAHHGTLSQAIVVQLIGADYLAANPPQYGNSTSTYNDSELYFIYVLKCIEENAGNVRKGIAEAVTNLVNQNAGNNMDFVFSNGTTLWAFHRGGDSTHLVYYYYNSTSPVYSAVASQYPTSSQGSWIALSNFNLVEMNNTGPPLVIDDIRAYAPIDHFDSTVNKNDGAAHGGVVISAEGKINGGDKFDGADDYVSVNDSSTLDGDGLWSQLTVELWVKANSPTTPGGQRILRKGPSSGTGVNSYQIGLQTSNGRLYFDVWHPGGTSGAYYEVEYTTVLTAGTWYHVVCTYISAVGSKIYVNGIDVNAVKVGTGSETGNVSASDAQPLYIGARYSTSVPGPANFFNGTIDEMRISRAARSVGWITTSYTNQNDPSHFSSVGTEEIGQTTTMRITPATTDAVLGADYTVYVEILGALNLYAWEFQLDYNPTILDLTSCSIVEGGLNEPTNTYYNLTDEVNGHVWWAVSTIRPTATGISYPQHAIFEIHYHTIAVGTSYLGLHGTLMSDSTGNPIVHEVENGSITVTGAIDLTTESVRILDQGCSVYANDTYANGTAYYYPVEVTVRNLGAGSAGPFYVKLEVFWINGSTTETMREEYVSGLSGGASVVINFTNFFHPSHTQYYRLIATADSTNTVTESNEANNAFTLDNVKVTTIGDANGDGVVNILDGVVLTMAWTGTPGSPQWNVKSDVNHDRIVNIFDGTRLSLNWGARW